MMKMKKTNRFFSAFAALLLVVVICGCASVRDQKREVVQAVLSADGSAISFAVKGTGEPTLVFIHCWVCDHTLWEDQVEYFSRNHKVVWLDLAGHGLSGSSRSNYTMEAFGEDVAAVVKKVGGKRVVLVGHSMGGPVSVEAASLLGDKVVAVVGVDTFYTPFHYPESEAAIDSFMRPFEKDFTGTAKQMLQSMFTPDADPERKAALVKKLPGASPETGISALHELMQWGMHNVPGRLESCSDKLWNINAAPTGEEVALNEHVTLIPGVGHFVPQIKPEAFNAALSKIISEIK